MSVLDEREASENNQWRRTASAVRRLGGVLGGGKASPSGGGQLAVRRLQKSFRTSEREGQLCCPDRERGRRQSAVTRTTTERCRGGRGTPAGIGQVAPNPIPFGTQGAWHPGYTVHHAVTGPHHGYTAPRTATEQAPGLRGLFLPRVKLSPRTTSPTAFPYLRSISSGHPDRPQTIRDRCWIASRSRPARAGLGYRAWRVPRARSRASWRPWRAGSGVPDARIRAGQTLDPGWPDPGSRDPGQVTGQDLATSGQF